MTTITIPATLAAAVRELKGLDALLTAKGWERAAIVAAFVRLEEHAGQPSIDRSVNTYSTVQFAALGVSGLTSHTTVRRYVQLWLDQNEQRYPKPGRRVKLPTTTFPPKEENLGGRVSTDPQRAVEQVIEQHGPAAIAAAARNPKVATAIVKDRDAHLAVIKASTTRTPKPRPLPDHSEPAARALLAVTVDRLGADAAAMRHLAMTEFSGDYVWRPGECERLIKTLQSVVRCCQDVTAVLTIKVSDEDLAGLLGQ